MPRHGASKASFGFHWTLVGVCNLVCLPTLTIWTIGLIQRGHTLWLPDLVAMIVFASLMLFVDLLATLLRFRLGDTAIEVRLLGLRLRSVPYGEISSVESRRIKGIETYLIWHSEGRLSLFRMTRSGVFFRELRARIQEAKGRRGASGHATDSAIGTPSASGLAAGRVLRLMVAIMNNDVPRTLAWLNRDRRRRRPSVNTPGTDGLPPLVVACRHASPEIVGALLDHGADPNLAGPGGMSPFKASFLRSDLDAARLLLEHPRLDIAAVSDRTIPLSAAIIGDRLDVLKQLLDLGFDPNATESGSLTLLMLAAREANVEAFGELLERGADPTVTVLDEDGEKMRVEEITKRNRRSSTDGTRRGKYDSIAKLLRDWKRKREK